MSSELSRTIRAYLADIYRLSDGASSEDAFVSTSALAESLDVSAPAVNRMISKLKESGLLVHEPYQGMRLTDAGKSEALKELRRHRITESFLVAVMGFGWHEVHAEANLMSGSLSESITERMAIMAGFPTHCPHGEPIPSADGTLSPMNDHILANCEANHDYIITRVRTREPDRLEYLAALSLIPGTRFHLINRAPFNGPLQLKVANEYRIIGHNLAELIRVKVGD